MTNLLKISRVNSNCHKGVLNNIGTVNFVRSSRSKRISIRIKSKTEIRVSYPNFISLSDAVQFAEAKSAWIIKVIEKLSSKSQFLIDGKIKSLKTDFHFIKAATDEIKFIQDKSLLKILIPQTKNILDNEIRERTEKKIIEVLRKDSKIVLPEIAYNFAEKFDLKIGDVRIKNMKSRWGSCSSKNNINLSLYLMLLPRDLIEYVILHELAHITHKNHKKNFWNLLNNYCPNAKIIDRKLRNFAPNIF